MISVKVQGNVFAFDRSHETGEGFWICTQGKDPTSVGNITTRNRIVALDFAKELTQKAVDQGLGTFGDFVPVIRKEKHKPVSIAKEPKIKDGKIRFGFNPFKSAPVAEAA